MCTHCLYRTCTSCAICSSLARRDRSSSGSRSVEFRTEIGPLPHRDRSPPTTEPRTSDHHLHPATQSSRSAQDRDRTRTRASTPSMRTGKKSVGRMRRLHSLPAFNQCSRHTCQQPRSSEVRRFRTTSAKKCATTPQPDHRRPNPGRKRTDLEPEVDRSQSGVRPISKRSTTDLEAEVDRSRRDDRSNLTEHRPSPLYEAVIH